MFQIANLFGYIFPCFFFFLFWSLKSILCFRWKVVCSVQREGQHGLRSLPGALSSSSCPWVRECVANFQGELVCLVGAGVGVEGKCGYGSRSQSCRAALPDSYRSILTLFNRALGSRCHSHSGIETFVSHVQPSIQQMNKWISNTPPPQEITFFKVGSSQNYPNPPLFYFQNKLTKLEYLKYLYVILKKI